ncbi:uncharacterized protein LOC134848573 [Symsagittifera roscoffensis]|uniref:uncharacterized protein LOC134848573 n=1 Tax=Symsagittifera roscoffensis TaxID=84072 RepID=UPI00307B1D6A
MSLADQMKTWFELESYGAFKQVDARSAADKRALSVLKNDTFHDGERYIVPMLWNDKESTLPNNYFSSLAQLKSLEKRLAKDPSLRKKYAETIREDVQKGYVITVKAQDPKSRANREWYLPHHPVLNPNKHGKVRRVVNGASKCHGASLNKSLCRLLWAVPSSNPEKFGKEMGFLFTCLTTRAVHIEVVPSLDTSSSAMGVERFIARPGTPTTIKSDNGSIFVGAQKELLACVESWNQLAPAVFVQKGSSGNSIHPAHRTMVTPGSD